MTGPSHAAGTSQTAFRPFFISGYPRSGSTLLAAILLQNPQLHASYSSPVGPIVRALLNAMGAQSENDPLLTLEHRADIIRGAFCGYYKRQIQQGQIVFDTNRLWCSKLDLLHLLFPGTKVIACVRDVAEIVESLERLTRSNPQLQSQLYSADEVSNLYTRVEALMKPLGLIGIAESATLEAAYSSHSSELLLLEYDALVLTPEAALHGVYAFLGHAPFQHDFGNIAQIEHAAYDARLGVPDLHTIRPSVQKQTYQRVLPPDLRQKLQGRSFWRQLKGFPPEVSLIMRPPSPGSAKS